MNAPSGNQKPSFWDFLLRLFGLLKPSRGTVPPPPPPQVVIPPDNTREPARVETVPPPPPPQPVIPPDNTPEPVRVETVPPPPPPQPVIPLDNTTEPVRVETSRVLLVIYNPIMDAASGKKIIQSMNWNNPDDLSNSFIQDILEVSVGLARFQIVDRVELNEFPALTDGFRYDAGSYMAVINKTQPAHQPEYANYQAILTGLNVIPRITNREIDEVWLMGFPQAGFYESTMCGAGAFWCNSQPQTWSAGCSRRFVVMGFSSERGVGEMLHSFGHRVESILTQSFSKTQGTANLYAQFALYDKVAPGRAQVGDVHFPPNADSDYDYNNPRKVLSNCYDWYNFPAFKNDIREVNADEWGNGDMHILHKWWLSHLPKVAGRTSGVVNNWWQYTIDPNLVN
jgi:hypothetical protein